MAMNQMNMTGMNSGHPGVGGMQAMNNLPNGAMPRQGSDQNGQDHMERLNTWIYAYLMEQEQYDAARALKNSSLSFSPEIVNSEDETNGINDDSKAGASDVKRPADLPIVKQGLDTDGGSMLSGWFAVFWDIFAAHGKRNGASKAASQLMEQNRMRGQGRGDQMFRGPVNGVMGNQMDPNMLIRYNNDLRHKAMQNQQQNGFRSMNPQMQMAVQRNAMMHQQNMRRDPSGMDMNGQRPRTPSSGDHAPSPKRPRMDGTGFNPQQMMQNGRPPPGMPPHMMAENTQQANQLLVNSGINPANLSDTQFASFQQQQPAVQQKSIQVFAQSMAKNQREGTSKAGGMSDGGSPMMPDAMNMSNGGPDFYNATGQMLRGPMGPNPGPNGVGGNHALQDYQMQLMLLEQQNKKRLLMARQEQDGPGQPGVPGGFAPSMSPSGSRGGPSPGPGGDGRGTPKLGPPGMGGSPLPDGSMRGSPAAMGFNPGQQQPDFLNLGQGVRQPPSSNPAFNGQFNPQQMQQMQQMRQDSQGRMPSGNWQGPPGQGPMGQQPQMPPQPPQMGTPQQKNDMPPPQAPATGAANGRNGSDDPNPPTPQQTNKSHPKPKKDSKKAKGEGKSKKNANNNVAVTPVSEAAENPPPTPTPTTPTTATHPNSFSQKDAPQAGANQANNNAAAQPMSAPQQDLSVPPQFGAAAPSDDQADGYNVSFNDQMQGDSLLDNFNFEEFLDNNAFQLDLSTMEVGGDMLEAPMADAA